MLVRACVRTCVHVCACVCVRAFTRVSMYLYLPQVLSSLSSVLQSDPEDKPRQAASLALKSIVMGLGPDLVKVQLIGITATVYVYLYTA